MEYTLTIKFDRANQTYRPGDTISGIIGVNFPDQFIKRVDINAFNWRSEGVICLQNKETHKELEKISQALSETLIHLAEGQITKDKYIQQEKNTFPFKFTLNPYQDKKIIETYVGVYVAIAYEIQIELKLQNGLNVKQSTAYFVQVPNQGADKLGPDFKFPKPEQFRITPDKLQSSNQQRPNASKFRISGQIDSTICIFQSDFNGSLIIEECEADIRTIDLQLIRVEKIENRMGKLHEATEIQLIQIVEGNATRGLEIPFHMLFPKYFSCPNFKFREFEVDFEVNLLMILYDGFKVTLNFPITIIRK